MSMSTPGDTLERSLTRRLREVLTGAAATEGELRRLKEQAEGLARTLAAGISSSESQLSALATKPDATVAEMAAELRRVERLREELDDLRADLAALASRARTLRGAWMRRSG
jgi:polyhydroxyalkanoate synthesis regulator phasin